MFSYVEHRFSPLKLPGFQLSNVAPFCTGDLLDPADAEHAARKRSHSYGHPSLISDQMDSRFSICRPPPVNTSFDKDVLTKADQQFQLSRSTSRCRCNSESTWEGENGNMSRDVSPSSSPMSFFSNEDCAMTSTCQTPARTTIPCEERVSQVSCREKLDYMLANDMGVTLMIRNLPNTVMQGRILQKLAEQNLQDRVRLVYVPVAFGHSQKTLNKGFAFIHTADRNTADMIMAMWHRNFVFGRNGVTRSLNIALAHTQGLAENMENWRKSTTSRIRNPYYSPLLVMEDGETVIVRSFNFSDLLPQMKAVDHTYIAQLQSLLPAELKQ